MEEANQITEILAAVAMIIKIGDGFIKATDFKRWFI
jgi:hypothetical protein